jgi:hypothetical protein
LQDLLGPKIFIKGHRNTGREIEFETEFKRKDIRENLFPLGLTCALPRAMIRPLNNTWITANVKMKMCSWFMPVWEIRGYLPLNQETA